MPSLQSKIVNLILRIKKMKGSTLREFERNNFNYKNRCPEPPASLQKKLNIEKQLVEGHPLFIIHRKSNVHPGTILYLHGGAYIHGFTYIHWKFISQIAERSGYTLLAPDYPVAPTHTYRETYSMLDQVYQMILKKYSSEPLTIMGDSSGGGLSVGFTKKLVSEKQVLPKQLILLSPWLDLSMSHPGISVIDPMDPLIESKGLRKAADAWAGDTDIRNPLISPINGDLKGLPPIHLFIGTRDILLPDCDRFHDRCLEVGTPIFFHRYLDMVHVWMILPLMPESKKAQKEILNLLN